MHKKPISLFLRRQDGGVAIYIGLLIGLLITILTFAMNYGQTSYYKNFAQNSLDAALLGAVSNVGNSQNNADLVKIAKEANEIFISNIADKRGSAAYSNIQVKKEQNGTYTATMVVSPVPGAGTGYIEDKFTAPMTLTSKVGFGAEGRPTEVSIALDTSLSMSGGKLTSAKSAVNTLINQVYGNKAIIDTLKISIIPFSDAVKIEPKATSNRWLLQAYNNANNFSGCMVRRANDNAYTDQSPLGGNATRFPRFLGPFDDLSRVDIYAMGEDNRRKPALQYNIADSEIGVNVNFISETINGGRFDPEIDFLYDKGGITGSERIVIDYGAEYRNAISRMYITAMFKKEGEIGGWATYNNTNSLVNSGTFRGANEGDPFELLNIIASQPLRKVEFFAVDNGIRTPDSNVIKCPSWWGRDPRTGRCVLDNSDYGLRAFTYVPNCSASQALFTESRKSTLVNAVNALQTDGPTRTDRGMAWAYYALSPKWRNVLPNSSASIPRSYDSNANRKIAILLSNAANYGGAADNASTLEICKNMKRDGIEIFTISFGAPADAQAMLQQCSSTGGNYYFNAPDEVTLAEAFKDIARDISSLKLIE